MPRCLPAIPMPPGLPGLPYGAILWLSSFLKTSPSLALPIVRRSGTITVQSGPTNPRPLNAGGRAPSDPLTYRPGAEGYGTYRQPRLTYFSSMSPGTLLSSGRNGRIRRRYLRKAPCYARRNLSLWARSYIMQNKGK
ncbi:hypothetical protein BDP81DRAFT_74404 [Colletotrichum phormii]|uniref:Uncharacterized protein n=1 Tax=Colletotrichum phormii TaxID=359342 RepID=A0AAI9ZLN0_9PEZI|nr:uncharacterized protein BDP81DRAFT_74404 [Colletotrichum phormii]KAK1625566.1 hypothetical protein BDP81DRAFT_74404 [Colletotrichum phormii]